MNSIKKAIYDKIATKHVARFRSLASLFENSTDSEQKVDYAKKALKELEKVRNFDPGRCSLISVIYNTRILDIYANLT